MSARNFRIYPVEEVEFIEDKVASFTLAVCPKCGHVKDYHKDSEDIYAWFYGGSCHKCGAYRTEHVHAFVRVRVDGTTPQKADLHRIGKLCRQPNFIDY